MTNPYAVVFAGVPGTSKSPIAHYLSCEFNLPIINNDQIRYEVREDLGLKSINEPGGVEEFERLAASRSEKILASKSPIIFDSSVDRRWSELQAKLVKAGYDWFMIDLELSKKFLEELFAKTGRQEWAEQHLDMYLEQHEAFMSQFSSHVDVCITDKLFATRLEESAKGLRHFLASRETK